MTSSGSAELDDLEQNGNLTGNVQVEPTSVIANGKFTELYINVIDFLSDIFL